MSNSVQKTESKRRTYSHEVMAEVKRLFVVEKKSPRQIAALFNGKPCENSISGWSKKRDKKTGKNWQDELEEYQQAEFERIAPPNLVRDIVQRIQKILSSEENDIKAADALAKMQKALERLSDPSAQVPAMYHLLTEFMEFVRENYRDLITDRLVEAVRNFRTVIRRRLG